MDNFGLIGERLSHSLSPDIHESIFEYIGINAQYNLFCVEKKSLSYVIQSLKVLGIKGVNVTIPYKEDIMQYLDYVSIEAEKIGAVNTILIEDGKALGYNTDYYGFGKMLEKESVSIDKKSFYVLGAGGAAKSIVHYLKDKGASKVIIVSRNKEKAVAKFRKEEIEVINYEELTKISNEYAVINTTPCGMYPKINATPIDKEILKKFNVAIDIVYNPQETLFLKLAKELNLKVVEGLVMLIGQGTKAEEIWNKIKIDESIEQKIYNKILNKLKNQ